MTVYVPQLPSKFDIATGLWIPTVNINPARKHGALEVMLPPGANRLDAEVAIDAIKRCMQHYDESDFIVALGDPTLIAAAACIAARKTDGLLRMLKWDRQTSDYIAVEIQLWA